MCTMKIPKLKNLNTKVYLTLMKDFVKYSLPNWNRFYTIRIAHGCYIDVNRLILKLMWQYAAPESKHFYK